LKCLCDASDPVFSYAESANFIYTANIFYHIGVESLGRDKPATPLILPPTANLRSIIFEYNVDSVLFRNGLFIFRPSSRPFTPDTWKELGDLPNLRSLLINFVSYGFVANSVGSDLGNSERAVFSPLRDIRHLDRFDVVVRWKCSYKPERQSCRLQGDYTNAPFNLTEIQDHVIKDRVIAGNASTVNIFYWAEGVINKMGHISEPSPNMRDFV
jgi:hypothetical protein